MSTFSERTSYICGVTILNDHVIVKFTGIKSKDKIDRPILDKFYEIK